MPTITDEYMYQLLATTRPYTIVILKPGPQSKSADAKSIIWEHGRRNLELRASGEIAIVCPIMEESVLDGIYIFNSDAETTSQIMEGDPGVMAGVFVFEVYPCISFPGDKLGE